MARLFLVKELKKPCSPCALLWTCQLIFSLRSVSAVSVEQTAIRRIVHSGDEKRKLETAAYLQTAEIGPNGRLVRRDDSFQTDEQLARKVGLTVSSAILVAVRGHAFVFHHLQCWQKGQVTEQPKGATCSVRVYFVLVASLT